MRANNGLISLSIIILIAAMGLEGLLFLPLTNSSLKAQIQTVTPYVFIASIVMLAVIRVSSAFKRRF